MNSDIERLYQEIGAEASRLVPGLKNPLLVYCEVEDGVVSCDLFFGVASGGATHKIASRALSDLVHTLWEKWRAVPGATEWRSLEYTLNAGRFSIDLVYPDKIDPDEDPLDRRDRVARKHFGGNGVDYSNPRL